MRKCTLSGLALLLLTSFMQQAAATNPISINSAFDSDSIKCVLSDDSLIYKLSGVYYKENMPKSIEVVGFNQIKYGDNIVSQITSFVNEPIKGQYETELKSLKFSADTDDIKIVRLAFIEGYDWSGYSYDIEGTDDKIQNFLDKYSLNNPVHPVLEINTTPDGLWRVTCDISGA